MCAPEHINNTFRSYNIYLYGPPQADLPGMVHAFLDHLPLGTLCKGEQESLGALVSEGEIRTAVKLWQPPFDPEAVIVLVDLEKIFITLGLSRSHHAPNGAWP
ncbi:hypothetical protein NDU88_007443 [Pleurodeles waltl]|uniref:Uncharacterized protein n=1 Tax=Pleurodeles waltl TaxID=8319 RepID=A0AAV7PLA3_PLEWA|nr:hypothetical protein NDU88_007443 [Pleurodeles waltl]